MFKSVDPKPSFPEMEKKILKWWYESGLVNKYLHKNYLAKKKFSFMDGPITANNPMGVHHGWSRTFKDIWQRYHNMKGEKQRFQNGFDCQGLWVEVEVEKELGFKSKKDIEKYGVAKFVEKCKERVRKYATIQTDQSKRLAYFMDWDHSYYTMSDENNYTIWHFLKVCWERGWIYKGHDVVPWCPRCETAISEHEILTEDYKELTHDSVILRLKINKRANEYLLIWTTTPWTIPANTAVTVDSDLDYVLVDTGKDKYWVAEVRKMAVFGTEGNITKKVKGRELAGLDYISPYDHIPYVTTLSPQEKEKFHRVYITDPRVMPISTTEGTGLVHTSTSTGQEDFRFGKTIGLPVIPTIDDEANYLRGFGELEGKNAKKNPEIILDYLKESKGAYKIFPYKHRYPACWRCKAELVWRIADEWYIEMDRPSHKASAGKSANKTLREQLIEVAKKINWLPKFGLERELDWLKNMHDWLISKKNRYWGLTIPIYECQKCGFFEVIGGKDELKKRAVEGWHKFDGHTPHKPWIDEVKIKCYKCGEKVSRIADVGNPWLDAGIVSFSTITEINQGEPLYFKDKNKWQEWFPADFITESFPGQFKNWFYSLIVMSTVLEAVEPCKTILGFATLLGEDGRPMHKSWGNAIEFNEGANKIGVDVMRWMYATQNPADNLLFGYHKADAVRRKFHLLLWNIYNFFVTYVNIDQWEPHVTSRTKSEESRTNVRKRVARSLDFASDDRLHVLDRWIISKSNQLIKVVTDSLDNYDAQTGSLAIQDFVDDLSTWYVRRSRDRIGPTVEAGDDKNACCETLYQVLVTLSLLLSPFTPFIAEEIYKNLTGEESVHLAEWPKEKSKIKNPPAGRAGQKSKLLEDMEFVRKVCELGHAKRKEKGIKVRQPLKKLKIQSSKLTLNKEYIQLIKDELNVKEVEIVEGEGELSVELDTFLTPRLIEEGKAREIVRQIQIYRKKLGYSLTEKIRVTLPKLPSDLTAYVKKETLAYEVLEGNELKVERI